MNQGLLFTVGFVCGSLVTFLVMHNMFRTFLRMTSKKFQAYSETLERKEQKLKEKKLKLQEQKTAITKLLDGLNHSGTRPLAVTIEGLCNVIEIEIKSLREVGTQTAKPNHHRWGDLLPDIIVQIEGYVQKIKLLAQKLVDQSSDLTRKYEGLQ